jgi:5-oxoprolinase (ATP-hydrolysing)
MANAIKKISVQRGYDVTKYALASFGGRGGAACLPRRRCAGHEDGDRPSLRGRPVGLRHGPRRYPRPAGGAVRRGPDRLEQAEQRLSELAEDGHAEVEGQGIDPDRIRIETRAHLKYAGSHQALAVPFGPADALRESFEAEHRSRFGFVSADRDSSSTCWRWRPSAQRTRARPRRPRARARRDPSTRVDIHGGGDRDGNGPDLRRDDLPQGTRIDGPAIVSEATGTTMIEPGWQGRIDALGNLILNVSWPPRAKPRWAPMPTR